MPNTVHVWSDRRAAPRFATDLAVEVQADDGVWRRTCLLDVSMDGARLMALAMPTSATLRLRFRTDWGDVELLARTLRAGSQGLAVEYLEMSVEALERYARWLDGVAKGSAGAVSASN